jgi:hypothetical protein
MTTVHSRTGEPVRPGIERPRCSRPSGSDLHHPDAETVDRFGNYLVDDTQYCTQFRWLHGGPSGDLLYGKECEPVRFVRPDMYVFRSEPGSDVLAEVPVWS